MMKVANCARPRIKEARLSPASSEKGRILLVGDLSEDRALMTALVRRGFAVDSAADPVAAVRLASTTEFDVVAGRPALPRERSRQLGAYRWLRRQVQGVTMLLLVDEPSATAEQAGFIVFPRSFPAVRLLNLVEQSVETARLRRENAMLRILLDEPRERMTLAAAERRQVERAVQLAGGNKTRAAAMLGVTRRQLYHLLDRLAGTDGNPGLKPALPMDERR